jgi:hypothetical protein
LAQAVTSRPRCQLIRKPDEVVKLDVQSLCHAAQGAPSGFSLYLRRFKLADGCRRKIPALRHLLARKVPVPPQAFDRKT